MGDRAFSGFAGIPTISFSFRDFKISVGWVLPKKRPDNNGAERCGRKRE